MRVSCRGFFIFQPNFADGVIQNGIYNPISSHQQQYKFTIYHFSKASHFKNLKMIYFEDKMGSKRIDQIIQNYRKILSKIHLENSL